MPKEPKVVIETVVPADVYKRLGPISRAASAARFELGELPITYVTNRGSRTVAMVPPWAAEWMERHAAEMLESLAAEADSADS